MTINPDVEGLYQIVTVPKTVESIVDNVDSSHSLPPNEAWCVKIVDGFFEGIIYTYGKIDFQEKNEQLIVKIEHDILFVPEDKRVELTEEQYREWEQLIGKIAVNIIHDNSDKFKIENNILKLEK